MGFKCPDMGMLTKPIFNVAPRFRSSDPQLGNRAEHPFTMRFNNPRHAGQHFL
jgi:hypothetical protein